MARDIQQRVLTPGLYIEWRADHPVARAGQAEGLRLDARRAARDPAQCQQDEPCRRCPLGPCRDRRRDRVVVIFTPYFMMLPNLIR